MIRSPATGLGVLTLGRVPPRRPIASIVPQVFNADKKKWYILSARNEQERRMWLEAFELQATKVAQAAKNGVSLVDLAAAELGASGSSREYVRKIHSRTSIKPKGGRSVRQSRRTRPGTRAGQAAR